MLLLIVIVLMNLCPTIITMKESVGVLNGNFSAPTIPMMAWLINLSRDMARMIDHLVISPVNATVIIFLGLMNV